MNPELRKPDAGKALKPEAPSDVITGGMTVSITIGEVSLTLTGPVAKVVAVMNWLFGSAGQPAQIANLQLVFGAEVSKRAP